MSFLQTKLGQEQESGSNENALLRAETAQTLAEFSKERPSTSDMELQLKGRIHNDLIAMLDVSRLFEVSQEQASRDVAQAARQLLDEDSADIPYRERGRIVDEIVDEVFGMGPLTPLLRDSTIGDILVNGPNNVFVERAGVLELTKTRFKDNDHLRRVMDRIVSAVGRRLNEASPMVDARLPDGSRVNAIIPPLAVDGPCVSIRRFPSNPLSVEDLIRLGTMTEEVAVRLESMVSSRKNILVIGGTGSGKTTLLNALSSWISPMERIVTIEDSAELALRQDHVVRLETRIENVEGVGAVSIRNLVVNSLRMRPDRIIVGEVRGDEVLDMLQALNTGHDGSMTTMHANSPRDAMARIEALVGMAGVGMEPSVVRSLIVSAFDIVIHVTRAANGSREIATVCEVVGLKDDAIALYEVVRRVASDPAGRDEFIFDGASVHTGDDSQGSVRPNSTDKSGLREKANSRLASR